MKEIIRATIRWSTWGIHEHGHGYRTAKVEAIPDRIDLIEGKLYPVYNGETLQEDELLKLIRSVEEGCERVRKEGTPGFGEIWFNREMFEITFRVMDAESRHFKVKQLRGFWANEGWKEHKYD
jgi:hypothetical protein